jgi:hypothetical protein
VQELEGLSCHRGRRLIRFVFGVDHDVFKPPRHPIQYRHFDRQIIILCVRWYVSYKLSYRDLVEIWPAINCDLDALTDTEIDQDGKRFLLRSAPRLAAYRGRC